MHKTTLWNTDDELYQIAKSELFVALVGDILDKMGFQNQFLPPKIKPLRDDFVVIGRAMTVLEADVFEEVTENSNNPVTSKTFWVDVRSLRQSNAK